MCRNREGRIRILVGVSSVLQRRYGIGPSALISGRSGDFCQSQRSKDRGCQCGTAIVGGASGSEGRVFRRESVGRGGSSMRLMFVAMASVLAVGGSFAHAGGMAVTAGLELGGVTLKDTDPEIDNTFGGRLHGDFT